MTEAASTLALEIVRSAEALEALEAPWWELAAKASGATPFQTPGWLLPWWRHLGRGELAVVVVRDGARLCAVAPFAIVEAPTRRLVWLGAGISDYFTALVGPEREGIVWPLVVDGIAGLLAETGAATLDNVPDDAPLLGWLERLPAPWTVRRESDATCLVGALDADVRVSAKAAAAERRLARAGVVAFSSVGGSGADEPAGSRAALLDALFDLHGRRWRSKDEDGVLVSPAVRAHHREASEALGRQGLLRLHGLSHGGEMIGVVYAFVFRACLWMYLGGFSPEHHRFSPGSVLISRARAAARVDGASAFDFLRGQESYKYRWGVRARRTWRVDIAAGR